MGVGVLVVSVVSGVGVVSVVMHIVRHSHVC